MTTLMAILTITVEIYIILDINNKNSFHNQEETAALLESASLR